MKYRVWSTVSGVPLCSSKCVVSSVGIPSVKHRVWSCVCCVWITVHGVPYVEFRVWSTVCGVLGAEYRGVYGVPSLEFCVRSNVVKYHG